MDQESKHMTTDDSLTGPDSSDKRTVPEDKSDSSNTRVLDRKKVYVDLPAFDANRRHRKGYVIDITSRGIGLRKVHANTDDVIHWVVCADEHFPVDRFSFVAKCRWTSVDKFNNEPLSGFQIIRISPEDSAKLRRFLLFLGSRYFRDLTAHLRTEESLRSEEALYRSIVESQSELVLRFSPDSILSFVNQAFCNLAQKNKDELIGSDFFDWVASEQKIDFINSLSLLTPEKPETLSESCIALPSGQVRSYEWSQKCFFDDHGTAAFYQLVGRELTEKRLNRENSEKFRLELKGSDRKLPDELNLENVQLNILSSNDNFSFNRLDTSSQSRVRPETAEEVSALSQFDDEITRNLKTVADRANFGLAMADIDGRIEYANDYFLGIHGLAGENVVGKHLSVFHSKDQIIEVNKLNTQLVNQGSFELQEVWHRHKSGREFPMLMSGVLLKDEKDHPTLMAVSGIDVTEMKQIQEALSHSQKMEAVGTLAGGIAHDVNNALFVMTGYADLALGDAEPGSRVANYLNSVLKAGHRIKEMVNQILTFGKGVGDEKRPLHLSPLLKEISKYMRGAIPGNVQMEERIDCQHDFVEADPTQLYQLIVNLIVNARDAMVDSGGKLFIGLDNIYSENVDTETARKLSPGKYVRLTVEDTGHGMTKEVRDRIFDPFFTTKQAGAGTGMGLSMIHTIIENHNAHIEVQSEVGKGTVFSVYFKVFQPQSEQTEFRYAAQDSVGSEQILFVDDEAAVLEMSRQLLQLMGYRVSTALSANEALQLIQRQPDKFDLVITDMTMPGMSGLQLAQEIKKIRPSLPIILCSGYTDVIEEDQASEMGISAYMTKPIGRSDLSTTIRQVLDRNSQHS